MRDEGMRLNEHGVTLLLRTKVESVVNAPIANDLAVRRYIAETFGTAASGAHFRDNGSAAHGFTTGSFITWSL